MNELRFHGVTLTKRYNVQAAACSLAQSWTCMFAAVIRNQQSRRMQVLRDNFFFHSKSRLGNDGDLENDRQYLVDEQKLCKVRARKFSVETNRRRKALDERRKQWDMQEQRLRENILQQRRQQVQDATERFQRAHLPLRDTDSVSLKFYTHWGQLRNYVTLQFVDVLLRGVLALRRTAANIEDALSEIQGTSWQPSFLSSNTNISRSCTSSPKPPTVSKSSHRQALSAVEAYTKLLQEQSRTGKYQDHSPQGSHLSECCNSESLSSKDSLETEDLNRSTMNPQCSYSSFFLDCEKVPPDLRKQNDLCPTSSLTSAPAMMLPDENVAQSRKLHGPKEEKQEDSEWPNNIMLVSKTSWGFTSKEQKPKTESWPSLRNCDILAICEVTGGDPEHLEVKSFQDSLSDNITVPNQVIHGHTAANSSYPKQEDLLDLKQQRIHDENQFRYPSDADIPFPHKNSTCKGILFAPPQKPDDYLKDSTTDNLSNNGLVQMQKERYNLPPQKDPCTSINNLNKISNSECDIEKPVNAASLLHASLNNIQSDRLKCPHCPDEEEQRLPVSVATSQSVCAVKGILKKQSKYVSGDAARMCGSQRLIFADHVALAIRDSVELSRTKTKEMGVSNTVKKKLRWFDEVHLEKEAKEQNTLKQVKSKSSCLSQPKTNSEDHQLSLITDSGSPKPAPSLAATDSDGYHFTKEAWTDVGVQVNLLQEQANEVKVPRSSTRTSGPKVPRRERPARVGAGPVSLRTRKGTVIRPQSATAVSQIAKTQGKIMVPRPPPRIESVEKKTPYITKTPYGRDCASINYKQALLIEQALRKNDSEGFFSPNTHPVITTDSAVMYTTLPHSFASHFPEDNIKSMLISGQQETHNNRRRGTVYSEKGLTLNCTPTDEEISQLWHGVRCALNTKDVKMHKRQSVESRRAVGKACVEQSRETPVSGCGRLPLTSQPTRQTAELVKTCSGTCDLAFAKEGLESAAQLDLGETHAENLQEEKRVVAAMETAQTQRPGTVRQHSQQQGLTAISFEEKKILLSLDRLNHQLHCLQEHVGVHSGTHALAVIDTPVTREVKVADKNKYRASSANRLPYQKRF
ncbi:centrosomal protein of 126 kDa [Leuresthes tenuis]|uniref:centrosomal protein of 126 kDa n=1 Tax=Leuresthes tenuis TaxID=355514 RepID=UPI003B508F4E